MSNDDCGCEGLWCECELLKRQRRLKEDIKTILDWRRYAKANNELSEEYDEPSIEFDELAALCVDLANAAEMLWVTVANVDDWKKQSPEWQQAAARWRDNFFKIMAREAA